MNLLKKIITAVTAVIILVCSGFGVHSDTGVNYQEKLGRMKTLVTSNDPSRFVRFTADGNTIYAEGFIEDDPAVDFYIKASNLSGMQTSFKTLSDGTFTSYYSSACTDRFGYAVVKLKSGRVLTYRAEYSGGWFFGDNGLEEENRSLIENSLVADTETCAYYVNESLDTEKTRQTLGEIRSITLEITEGADDDYQKAKALNYWVAENIYYDKDTYDRGVTAGTITLSNVLATKRTVCGGYANLYSALLEAAGIKAVNVKGGVVADGCTYEELLTKTIVHEWVAFWYEKEQRWVFTDPGWDSYNIYENKEYKKEPHGIKYFDMGEYAVSLSHRADRAEYREYLSANAFLQNFQSENEESMEQPENQILITEKSQTEKTAEETTFSEPGETTAETQDNTVLVIVIIILGIASLTAAAVFLTALIRKNKDSH